MKAVFPGHPIVIAVAIMKHYPSLEDAFVRTERNCPMALEDENIPGGGGNVYSALDALRYVIDGTMNIDEAVKYCNDVWDSVDDNAVKKPERYFKGIEEAKEYEPIFRGMLKGRGYDGN